MNLVLDLLYGSTPSPTFQLPDGRLQPDFLMDVVPNPVFFFISFAITALVCYTNVLFFPEDNERQQLMLTASMLPVLVHWFLFFSHALPQRSEKYFDLAGQIGMCLMLVFAFMTKHIESAWPSTLVLFLVLGWSFRLAYFLFSRMLERGEDWRFVRARAYPGYHFFTWTSQGLWCFFQGQAFLALFYSPETEAGANVLLCVVGALVWFAGLCVETTADVQKLDFVRRFPSRAERPWICEGLWKYSRHPNFCGETTCWIGISLVCLGAGVRDWNRLVFAPMFSMLFLQQTTLPWLDLLADAKYAGKPGYEEYKHATSKFWLLPPRPQHL